MSIRGQEAGLFSCHSGTQADRTASLLYLAIKCPTPEVARVLLAQRPELITSPHLIIRGLGSVMIPCAQKTKNRKYLEKHPIRYHRARVRVK